MVLYLTPLKMTSICPQNNFKRYNNIKNISVWYHINTSRSVSLFIYKEAFRDFFIFTEGRYNEKYKGQPNIQ